MKPSSHEDPPSLFGPAWPRFVSDYILGTQANQPCSELLEVSVRPYPRPYPSSPISCVETEAERTSIGTWQHEACPVCQRLWSPLEAHLCEDLYMEGVRKQSPITTDLATPWLMAFMAWDWQC